MKADRVIAIAGLLVYAAVAVGLPSYTTDFSGNYKIRKGSKIEKAGCAVCHVGETVKLNPYGNDLAKTLADAKSDSLTSAVFRKVEGLDSDKDGVTNLDEIKADTLPGDPKSAPAKKPVPAKRIGPAAETARQEWRRP